MLGNIFESFYSRLILRDIFGKIVPGGLVLMGLFSLQTPLEILLQMEPSFPQWVFLAGLAWLLGMTLQAIGMTVGLFRNEPTDEDNVEKNRIACMRSASENEILLLERFTIIKEAAGNGSFAFFFLLILSLMGEVFTRDPTLSAGALTQTVSDSALSILFAGAGVALFNLHRMACDKERKWRMAVIEAGPSPKRKQDKGDAEGHA